MLMVRQPRTADLVNPKVFDMLVRGCLPTTFWQRGEEEVRNGLDIGKLHPGYMVIPKSRVEF